MSGHVLTLTFSAKGHSNRLVEIPKSKILLRWAKPLECPAAHLWSQQKFALVLNNSDTDTEAQVAESPSKTDTFGAMKSQPCCHSAQTGVSSAKLWLYSHTLSPKDFSKCQGKLPPLRWIYRWTHWSQGSFLTWMILWLSSTMAKQ